MQTQTFPQSFVYIFLLWDDKYVYDLFRLPTTGLSSSLSYTAPGVTVELFVTASTLPALMLGVSR